MPIKIVHEWDEKTTRHRLKAQFYYIGEPPHATATYGDWSDYRSPAVVKYADRTFVYFSEYYVGCMPTGTVMELIKYDEQSL